MLERLVVAEAVPQPQPQRDSPKTPKKADSTPVAAAAIDKEPESTTPPPPVAEELTQEKVTATEPVRSYTLS